MSGPGSWWRSPEPTVTREEAHSTGLRGLQLPLSREEKHLLSYPRDLVTISVGLHMRITGPLGRVASLARFLDYVQKHDKVWIWRREDIARHWLRRHPLTS